MKFFRTGTITAMVDYFNAKWNDGDHDVSVSSTQKTFRQRLRKFHLFSEKKVIFFTFPQNC